ncbi:MAG: arylsulfatase, partial [Planctomycetota bacterium]|nr:arylsulfatase [Planctomycetota bacterium]
DLLPTIAKLSGQSLHGDNKIDGYDISTTFEDDTSPRTEFVFYSAQGQLEGIRMGDWKYLEKAVPNNRKQQNKGGAESETFLFNLAEDVGEQNNLYQQEPGLVAKLKARMLESDKEITANARPVWRKEVADVAK